MKKIIILSSIFLLSILSITFISLKNNKVNASNYNYLEKNISTRYNYTIYELRHGIGGEQEALTLIQPYDNDGNQQNDWSIVYENYSIRLKIWYTYEEIISLGNSSIICICYDNTENSISIEVAHLNNLNEFVYDAQYKHVFDSFFPIISYMEFYSVSFLANVDRTSSISFNALFSYIKQSNYNYNYGYNTGYNDGYNTGYNDGQAGENAISPVWNVLTGIFNSIGAILSIELVPHIPIGLLIFVPLFFIMVMAILSIWRKNW